MSPAFAGLCCSFRKWHLTMNLTRGTETGMRSPTTVSMLATSSRMLRKKTSRWSSPSTADSPAPGWRSTPPGLLFWSLKTSETPRPLSAWWTGPISWAPRSEWRSPPIAAGVEDADAAVAVEEAISEAIAELEISAVTDAKTTAV